jgi:hypothetical protein
MTRSMAVGLLAAVGPVMSALIALSHGDLFWVMVADACAAAWLGAYLAATVIKKKSAMSVPYPKPACCRSFA